MQVWNVLHTARWNTGRKNYAKNRSLRTIAQGCLAISSQIRHVSTIGKKLAKQQYGELRPASGWNRLVSLKHPSKFQRVSRDGFVTAPTSLNGGQPNFAQCLAVSCVRTLYIHFRGLLPPNGILPGAKFTLCPCKSCVLLYWQRYCIAWHSSSGHQPNFATWYKEWNYGIFTPHHFQQRVPPIFRGRSSRLA